MSRTYRAHYQPCPTHGREFCPEASCRTQLSRAQSGPTYATDPLPAPRSEEPGTTTPTGVTP